MKSSNPPGESTELIQRASDGDDEALDALIRTHEPSLLAFVRARVRLAALWDGEVQEH